jgi:hypothetical protein
VYLSTYINADELAAQGFTKSAKALTSDAKYIGPNLTPAKAPFKYKGKSCNSVSALQKSRGLK